MTATNRRAMLQLSTAAMAAVELTIEPAAPECGGELEGGEGVALIRCGSGRRACSGGYG